MRLPWPFRRSTPDGGATAAAAHGTVQRSVAPVRHDWAETGDLQPSLVGDPGIRVQRFADQLVRDGRAVVLSSVDMVDTEIDRPAQDGQCLRLVARRPEHTTAGQLHCAESDAMKRP